MAALVEELTLDLPESPDEPKPWIVQIWVYHSMTPEPFLDREEAIEYAAIRYEGDGCAVGPIINPAGEEDPETLEVAWQRYVRR